MQGVKNYEPQEYIEYFEDLSASGGLKFEHNADIWKNSLLWMETKQKHKDVEVKNRNHLNY